MVEHEVRTHKSSDTLPREQQLAWRLASVATDEVRVEAEVTEMVVNRLIDDAGVAAASLRRRPVANARAQALRHLLQPGAAVFGCGSQAWVSPEWAAWANCAAVRELDFHDTFLAAEYSHPGDNIPPLLAVAQHAGCSGHDLVRAIATAYEVQVDLPRHLVARPQDRPRSPPRSLSGSRPRHTPRAADGGRLPGDRPGPAHYDGHPPVAKGRDILVEGLRPGLRGQGRH